MGITLSQRAEELLRTALARHPDRSPSEILEEALAERLQREGVNQPSAQPPPAKKLTPEQFDKWLNAFTQFSDKIPPMPAETFSREMIYQDHD
jgi:hypothetical protein